MVSPTEMLAQIPSNNADASTTFCRTLLAVRDIEYILDDRQMEKTLQLGPCQFTRFTTKEYFDSFFLILFEFRGFSSRSRNADPPSRLRILFHNQMSRIERS